MFCLTVLCVSWHEKYFPPEISRAVFSRTLNSLVSSSQVAPVSARYRGSLYLGRQSFVSVPSLHGRGKIVAQLLCLAGVDGSCSCVVSPAVTPCPYSVVTVSRSCVYISLGIFFFYLALFWRRSLDQSFERRERRDQVRKAHGRASTVGLIWQTSILPYPPSFMLDTCKKSSS